MYEFNVNYLLKLLYCVPETWTVASFGSDCFTFRNDKGKTVMITHKELLAEYIAVISGTIKRSIFDE